MASGAALTTPPTLVVILIFAQHMRDPITRRVLPFLVHIGLALSRPGPHLVAKDVQKGPLTVTADRAGGGAKHAFDLQKHRSGRWSG